MRKTVLTAALAIVLALPIANVATAFGFQYVTARDNVPVTDWDSDNVVRNECVLASGTKVRITYWAGTVRRIQVIDGPNIGCSGVVQTSDLIQAPMKFPDVFHNF